MKKIIVALDGFSGCGKSTMAKELAREAGYVYVDTGVLCRPGCPHPDGFHVHR